MSESANSTNATLESKTQHVMRSVNGGWNVVKGGSNKATKHFSTQQEAISWGMEVAKKQMAEFYVHGKDGRVTEKFSFS